MGGCVSSPKDLALNEGEEAPVESSTTPKAEAETVAQEKVQEGGEKKEEPLVDLPEPKKENVVTKVEEAEVATEAKEPEKEKAKAEEKKDEPLVAL